MILKYMFKCDIGEKNYKFLQYVLLQLEVCTY